MNTIGSQSNAITCVANQNVYCTHTEYILYVMALTVFPESFNDSHIHAF